MRRPPSPPFALLLAFLLAFLLPAPGPGTRAPCAQEAPWAGIETAPAIVRTDEQPAVFVVAVVDARDGRPIAGARVRGYAEHVDGRHAQVHTQVVSLRADASGVALGEVDTQALGASHWVVSAPGYQPFADFHGYWPPERVALEPAVPMAVRLLGAFGEPLAGAEVEAFSGCPHAPPAAWGATDEEGVFRVRDGSAGGFELWARAPGQACRVQDIPPLLGEEPDVRVLAPGITVRGRVLDPDGRPVPGVVLRGAGYPRGPAALTGLDGRFALEGLDPGQSIEVFHPALGAADGTPHRVPRAAADVPLALVWALDGLGAGAATGDLLVEVRDAAGEPVVGHALLVLGSDGVGQAVSTNDEGQAEVALPAGPCLIRDDDPFAPWAIGEVAGRVPPDGEARLGATARPQVRFALMGEGEPGLALALVAEGRMFHFEGPAGDPEGPWLSPAARAAVQVRARDYAWATVIPVGPPQDGVRSAHLRLPPAHRIVVPGLAEDVWAFLAPARFAWAERSLEFRGGVARLRCSGSFVLRLASAGDEPDRLVPLTLPPLATGAVDLTVDPARDGRPDEAGRALVHLRRADGQAVGPVRVAERGVGSDRLADAGGEWDGAEPIEVTAPARVLLLAQGLAPLSVEVPRAGDLHVVYPAGGIDLHALDAAGAPVAAEALLGGIRYPMPAGRLSLRGLAAGAHALFVQRTGGVPASRDSLRWRFELGDSQVVETTLRLP